MVGPGSEDKVLATSVLYPLYRPPWVLILGGKWEIKYVHGKCLAEETLLTVVTDQLLDFVAFLPNPDGIVRWRVKGTPFVLQLFAI